MSGFMQKQWILCTIDFLHDIHDKKIRANLNHGNISRILFIDLKQDSESIFELIWNECNKFLSRGSRINNKIPRHISWIIWIFLFTIKFHIRSLRISILKAILLVQIYRQNSLWRNYSNNNTHNSFGSRLALNESRFVCAKKTMLYFYLHVFFIDWRKFHMFKSFELAMNLGYILSNRPINQIIFLNCHSWWK